MSFPVTIQGTTSSSAGKNCRVNHCHEAIALELKEEPTSAVVGESGGLGPILGILIVRIL